MKRKLALVMAMLMVLGTLPACSSNSGGSPSEKEEVLYPAGLPEQRLALSSRQAIRSIPPTQTILPMLTCL